MASGRALSVYVLEVVLIKSNQIPMDVKKKCIELQKQGMTIKDIYTTYYSKHYDTAFSGFKSMFTKWKKKHKADEKHLEGGNLQYKFKTHATTVQVDSEGQVIQSWIKSKSSDSMYMELIDTIKDLQPFDPIRKKEVEAVDRMLEITFDDMHFGVAFFDDYLETLQDTIVCIESHHYKEINIIMGEDLLHTDDFKGHTSNGTYIGEIDVPRAFNDTLKFYFNIIEKSLENSERVRVTYSSGNHSETLSWAILQVLKVKYPGAEYDDTLEPRKVLTFGKIFIGVTHGDTIKGSLRDVKELFVEENTMAYALATIKEIHIGHYHVSKETGDINGCTVRRLSTKVPADKWHTKRGFTSSVKRFTLFEYSSDKLLSIHYV